MHKWQHVTWIGDFQTGPYWPLRMKQQIVFLALSLIEYDTMQGISNVMHTELIMR